jgi:hypothetical protein
VIGKTTITDITKEIKEAKDMILVLNAIDKAVRRKRRPVSQFSAKNTPIVHATPFPPLKPKKTG